MAFLADTTRPTTADTGSLDEAAQQVLVQLRRSVSIVNVFPSNSPSYRRATEAVMHAFARFFGLGGPLVLEVASEHFLFHGRPLGDDTDREHYLGSRLYRDGIRQIVFQPGLTEAEILAFLKVAAPGRQDSRHVDTVSAFLSDEFCNLKFLVSQEVFAEEVILEDESEFSGAGAQQAALGFYRPLEEDLATLVGRIDEALDEDPGPLQRRLAEQARGATDGAVAALPDTLLAVLGRNLSAELKQGALARLVTLAGEAVDHGDIEAGLGIIRRVSQLPLEMKMLVRNELDALFGPTMLELLVDRLDESSGVVSPQCKQLLTVLGEHDLSKLVEVACRLGDSLLLVDVLAGVCKNNTAPLLELLNRRRDPKTVAMVAAVAARLGRPEAAEPLVGLLPEQPPWVVSQIVDTLAVVGGRHSRLALEGLLGDDQPYLRRRALAALARHGDGDTLRKLKAVVDCKEFAHRGDAEQQETFATMFAIAPTRATDLIASVLDRSRWFRRTALETMQLNLVAAAAAVHDHGVADCLQRHARRLGEDHPVGHAAAEAARRIEAALDSRDRHARRRMVG